ncbi:MAG: transposase [Verrucomicrobia bacterium]|nr:transposase [Verrucomicrobiota bacterium]
MKGKGRTTEEKIRILREADRGKGIIEVCRELNISEVTFRRWKREFGMMEVNKAKQLKELERENSELKRMLADSLPKQRVLEAIHAKMVSLEHKRWRAAFFADVGLFSGRAACQCLRLGRETYRYRARLTTGHWLRLVARIRVLSAARPRFGFRRIAALFRE